MTLEKTDDTLKVTKDARALKQYNICKSLAESKGGKLLTLIYSGSNVSHQWQCQYGRVWNATPGNIKTGTWCPFCAGLRIEKPHEKLALIATNKGGLLVTPTYLGGKTKHTQRSNPQGIVLLPPSNETKSNVKYVLNRESCW